MGLEEQKRGFVRQTIVALFLLLISIGFISALAAFGLVSSTTGLLIALVVFVGVTLGIRQHMLASELKKMRGKNSDLGSFERAIDRKLEKFSALHHAQIAANDSILKRINFLETESNTPLASASIIPMTSASASQNLAYDDMEHQDTAQISPGTIRQKPNSINAEQLTLHLQPVVDLERRQPNFYNSFVRLNTGSNTFMENEAFAELVEESGLNAVIDNKIVSSAMRMLDSLSSMKRKAGIFCSLSPETLGNEKEFSDLHRILKNNTAARAQIVLQISQRDFKRMSVNAQRGIIKLADMGYRLALSDIYDLELDAEGLAAAGFRYVCIGLAQLQDTSRRLSARSIHPSRLGFALRTHDIELIVTSVDNEADAASLVGLDISYASGLLFAPPRPVKPELVEAKGGKASLKKATVG